MARTRKNEPYSNSVLPAVYQNTTYFYDNAETYTKALHDKSIIRGRYGRYHNPSWESTEEILAQLDATDTCVLFPSGMSAIYSTLMTFAGSRRCFATIRYLYKNTRRIFERLDTLGLRTIVFDNAEPTDFIEALKRVSQEIDIFLVEMPSNPHLYIADIEKIRALLRPDALLIVDSTLASPHNFKPCVWGADLVIHSCTKYLNGHADLLLGSVAGVKEVIDPIRQFRDMTGAIPSPKDAFTLMQHLKTFKLRMDALNVAGQKLATFLKYHPMVSKVYYLGLDSHPHSKQAQKFFTNGYGGVVTFELNLSKQETSKLIDNLQVPYIASNFGGAETYVEHLSPFTYYNLSQEKREQLHITDSLVRLSVGFNDPIDSIINDLAINLARLNKLEVCG